MAKIKCSNGHVFEANIYGTTCPICGVQAGQPANMPKPAAPAAPTAPAAASPHTHIGAINPSSQSNAAGKTVVASGPTNYGAAPQQPVAQQPVPQQPASSTPRTTIRPAAGSPVRAAQGRKLVGFLVSYSKNPMGVSYNIYEGRNYIGRDASCDISIPEDTQMSSRHMSILYRNVDHKFKFRDEQSSNGTFVNKQLLDDGELENYDIIRVGSTLFVFVAIPQIG